MSITHDVRLRPVETADLQFLFEFQLDPLSNELAATNPRSASDFDSYWTALLRDSSIVVRSILVRDVIAGCISCFNVDAKPMIGYWIARSHWGRGVATQALQMFLAEIQKRPLHARVATTNLPSLRVLQKCGFIVVEYQHSPATERYRECEEALLTLQ